MMLVHGSLLNASDTPRISISIKRNSVVRETKMTRPLYWCAVRIVMDTLPPRTAHLLKLLKSLRHA
jgi:hypothetical protein